jgi:hypothetical protein
VLGFEEANPHLRKNAWGFVFFKDLFMLAERLAPHAVSLTFFNDDLIFNASLIDTLDEAARLRRAGKLRRFMLIVGIWCVCVCYKSIPCPHKYGTRVNTPFF